MQGFVSGMITTRLAIFTLLIVCCLAASSSFDRTMVRSGSSLHCADCNVILVSIDTLRADHLGCYEYPRDTTPNIDSFRKEAVLFRSTIAQAPSTTVSHGAMLTSLIPSFHGAFMTRRSPISSSVPTMAEILHQHGYRTASFNGGAQLRKDFGFDRGFDIYESFQGAPTLDRFSDRVREGIDWIQQAGDRKFFLFLHSYDVHHPYAPDHNHLDYFAKDYAGALEVPISPDTLTRINSKKLEVSRRDLQFIVDTYDAEIRGMDVAFGTLIEFLRSSKLLDRTIIVFTSDHGEEFGEHGSWGWHATTLFDELLRVPLLIKFPNQRHGGATINDQVRSIDILPTVLETLNMERFPHFQGVSLVPLLRGEKLAESQQFALSQEDTRGRVPPTSIQTSQWKALPSKLFDLNQDPGEHTDVAGRFADVHKALRTRVDTELALAGTSASSTQAARSMEKEEAAIDPNTLEQVRALGYVN